MSIATLKKKTQAQYNTMSVGAQGFSLNGTRRSSGYVGQDTLGRSLIRSLSRNGALKGHGGCCGKYPIHTMNTSPEMASLNDPTVIKSSSLNTNGLLMTKYRWIRRPQPFSTCKPGDRLNNNYQSLYINNLARETINCENVNKKIIKMDPCESCNLPQTYGSHNYNKGWKKYNYITKSWKKNDYIQNAATSTSQSEYIQNIQTNCYKEDIINIQKNTKGSPFACN